MTASYPGSLEQTLPGNWYLDEDIFTLEKAHIFHREWICAGREEDLTGPGDHAVLDLVGESILLLRNSDGALRAFYNVCRHRGAQLCPAADSIPADRLPLRGGVVGGRAILCPYHAWRYDLDGQLLSAPHMDTGNGFDPGQVQLYPVACRSWGGFVFLNLTPDAAPSFDEFIAGSDQRFKRYPLAGLRTGQKIRYEVDANWKVLCENYNECYHCGPVHPELCQLVPAFKDRGGADLDWERGIAHRDGAVTFTTTGTTNRRMFPGLNADEQRRHKGELLYPNLFLSLASDHVAAFILYPRTAGHTTIDCLFLFAADEFDRPDFDPADAVDFWHLVNRQDWSICERVQQGMSARVFERGVFSPMEDWNLDIRRYVSDRIGPYVSD